MTAEATGHVMWSPNPIKQRLGAYTIEDALLLPDDAPRVELRDGVMIVVPTPTGRHQNIGNLLWYWLRQNAPADFEPFTAVGVAINMQDTLEPDVVLLRRPVNDTNHFYLAEQVLVAVEVVSRSTKRRDRLEKPAEYAAAGIPHYWRIEQEPVHLFAYDLVGDHYELVDDSTDVLSLAKPFPLELRIRDITP
jgi:Uma2 family endonuclease